MGRLAWLRACTTSGMLLPQSDVSLAQTASNIGLPYILDSFLKLHMVLIFHMASGLFSICCTTSSRSCQNRTEVSASLIVDASASYNLKDLGQKVLTGSCSDSRDALDHASFTTFCFHAYHLLLSIKCSLSRNASSNSSSSKCRVHPYCDVSFCLMYYLHCILAPRAIAGVRVRQ